MMKKIGGFLAPFFVLTAFVTTLVVAQEDIWDVYHNILKAKKDDIPPEYGDIIMKNKIESMKKAGVQPVVFPHWFHRIRFKCKVCHEDIFIMKKGANDINMKKIMEGQYCGKCHNGVVAWEPIYCDRCHRYDSKKAQREQYEALKILPRDKLGFIDWAKATKEGLLKPKGKIYPHEQEAIPEEPFDLDIVIVAKADFMKDVIFPHWVHTFWLGCANCHPKIFIPSAGANKISMVEIWQGKWCGECHGKVAFPTFDCTRCHVKPKEKKTEKK